MSASTHRALEGVTIIDLTRVLAGPFCTMILADHGARVIKVELPDGGDDARAFGPFVDGQSGYFSSINRGKESIALDLKRAADRAIFEQLLEQADVLTENFRPGVMERMGYGWEQLQARYPQLVYGSVSGFGQKGSAYRDRPAYDMVVQGMSGIMSVTGQPGGPPTRVGVSIGDLSAGLFLTIGVVMALLRRTTTCMGGQVDIAMLDCQLALLEYSAMRHMATGETPGPVGSYRPAIAPPFGAYRTGDGHMVITAGNDKLFARLCEVLDAPDMAHDPRYADGEARKDHETDLQHALEQLLAARSSADWCALMAQHGVPCGPINTVDQMLADPHVAARGMLVSAEGGGGGPARLMGTPLKLSGSPPLCQVRAAPALDQDRARILNDFGIAAPKAPA